MNGEVGLLLSRLDSALDADPMKLPIPRSVELPECVQTALTPNRLAPHCNRRSRRDWQVVARVFARVADWNADSAPQSVSHQPVSRQWPTGDLKRAVDRRLDSKRPEIVEELLALDAPNQIGRKADFVVFLTGASIKCEAEI
jgi:hypothetical protein